MKKTILRSYQIDQETMLPFDLLGAVVPTELQIEFPGRQADTGYFWFVKGEPEEQRFVTFCQLRQYGVGFLEWCAQGKRDISDAGYYRLGLSSLASLTSRSHSIANVFGEEPGSCPHVKVPQLKKVVTRGRSTGLGLGTVLEGTRARGFGEFLMLVTRELKNALEALQVTGVSFEPCVTEGDEYSEDYSAFGVRNQVFDSKAEYYQMLINCTTRPIRVEGFMPTGSRARGERSCAVCGVISPYWVGREQVGRSDFENVDIQLLSEQLILDSNSVVRVDRAYIGNRIVVSGRLLREFYRWKPKGFSAVFQKAPKIEVCAIASGA